MPPVQTPSDVVEQTEELVRPCTDRFAVHVGLKPSGNWNVGFSVWGREAGGFLLSHGTHERQNSGLGRDVR